MRFPKTFFCGVIAVAASMIAASPAFAGAIQVSFDEGGGGSYQDTVAPDQNIATYGSATSGAIASFIGSDPYCVSNPASCVGGNVLIYELPTLVISGAVSIGEPGSGADVGSTDPTPSDVLFFTNAAGVNDGGTDANLMVFYSLAGDGAAADVGLPLNAASLIDKATENADGTFQWLPGGVTYPTNNEYDGFSGAPEPASLSMMLFGAGMLGFGAWRRRARG
jgi:PEP-CTERM motif